MIRLNVDSLFNIKHLHFLNPFSYISKACRLHFYKKIANNEIQKILRGFIFANGEIRNFSCGLIFAKNPKIRGIAKINPRKV